MAASRKTMRTAPASTFTIRLPADERAAIVALARHERLSESDVVRRLLREGFRRECERLVEESNTRNFRVPKELEPFR